MAITVPQMNASILNWNDQTTALQQEFNAARDSARIDRDVMVDDRTIGIVLGQFQTALLKGVNLVGTIKQSVTAFKKDASPELAATVEKAKQAWAKAILVVETGYEGAQAVQSLYTKDDINLADVDFLYDDYSAAFPQQGFFSFA